MAGNTNKLNFIFDGTFDGIETTLVVPHNLNKIPISAIVEALETADSNLNDFEITINLNDLTIEFTNAPVADTVSFSISIAF